MFLHLFVDELGVIFFRWGIDCGIFRDDLFSTWFTSFYLWVIEKFLVGLGLFIVFCSWSGIFLQRIFVFAVDLQQFILHLFFVLPLFLPFYDVQETYGVDFVPKEIGVDALIADSFNYASPLSLVPFISR